MDYFELLEQNTDDAEIQLQLYKACFDGAGRGNEEAEEWLRAAAANGNEEAAAIINERNAVKDNGSESRYANLSMLELLDYADSDYYAAKELIKRDFNCSWQEAIRLRKNICEFEESTVEDYEELAFIIADFFFQKDLIEKELDNPEKLSFKAKSHYEIYQILQSIGDQSVKNDSLPKDFEIDFVNACKSAIELGSESIKRLILHVGLAYINSNYSYISENFSLYDLSDEIAKSGDYADKYCHYCMLYSDRFSNVSNLNLRRSAWKEELERNEEAKDYPAEFSTNPKFDDLMDYVLNSEDCEKGTVMAYLALITLYKPFLASNREKTLLLINDIKRTKMWQYKLEPFTLYILFSLNKILVDQTQNQTESDLNTATPSAVTYENSSVPECPFCHSTNVSKISNLRKFAGMQMLGVFYANNLDKQWQCNNCRKKF